MINERMKMTIWSVLRERVDGGLLTSRCSSSITGTISGVSRLRAAVGFSYAVR